MTSDFEICKGQFLALEFLSLQCQHVTQQPNLTRLHNEDYKFIQGRGSDPKVPNTQLWAHPSLGHWAPVFNSCNFCRTSIEGRKLLYALLLLRNQGYFKMPTVVSEKHPRGWGQRKFRNCIYFVSTMSYSESRKTEWHETFCLDHWNQWLFQKK